MRAVMKVMVMYLVGLAVPVLCAGANDPIAGLVANAKPAIVTIITYDAKGKEDGQGTGFLVDEDHVVTCYHVIEGAARAFVKTAGSKVSSPVREIAASDRIADVVRLSLLIPVKGAKILSLSKSLPKQGERVVVVGTPLGLELTVSDGIVSAIRDIPGISKVIQITAPISPGSSGSPVLNLSGEVVGVVTSCLVGGQNLNFAVASERVLSLKSSPSALAATPSSGTDDKMRKEIRAGVDCYLQKDCAKALLHFEEATRLGPNDALAWGLRGFCYVELKRFSEAVDAYKEAIRIKPDYAEAHYNLGNTYCELKRFSEAVNAYKEAIRIKPDDAEANHNLGNAYSQLERHSEAVSAYKEAIRIKPDDAWPHVGLGGEYALLGRYSAAIDAYKQAIRINPDNADAHYELGVAYLILGHDKASALDEYKILKPLDSERANALFNAIYE